jgi:rhodanese-related sulfurtransferase
MNRDLIRLSVDPTACVVDIRTPSSFSMGRLNGTICSLKDLYQGKGKTVNPSSFVKVK